MSFAEAAQASARYRLHVHDIEDPEYVHDTAPRVAVVRVRVDGEPEVRIRKPPTAHPWAAVPGFQPLGEYVGGGGSMLAIPALGAGSRARLTPRSERSVSRETIPQREQLGWTPSGAGIAGLDARDPRTRGPAAAAADPSIRTECFT